MHRSGQGGSTSTKHTSIVTSKIRVTNPNGSGNRGREGGGGGGSQIAKAVSATAAPTANHHYSHTPINDDNIKIVFWLTVPTPIRNASQPANDDQRRCKVATSASVVEHANSSENRELTVGAESRDKEEPMGVGGARHGR
ncbi:hypothetical protein V6N13_083422 [Hibiscus sabdariffa]|uniref:Uncharacterized protein n=1 Tax=Hibiscus sabdariffa TaxID=183260 RepID=A0ABR2SXZ9_9ROSI